MKIPPALNSVFWSGFGQSETGGNLVGDEVDDDKSSRQGKVKVDVPFVVDGHGGGDGDQVEDGQSVDDDGGEHHAASRVPLVGRVTPHTPQERVGGTHPGKDVQSS